MAFALAARDPEARPEIPFVYVLDLLERRYGQPPGSAATWEPEALLRALEFRRLEDAVRSPRNG